MVNPIGGVTPKSPGSTRRGLEYTPKMNPMTEQRNIQSGQYNLQSRQQIIEVGQFNPKTGQRNIEVEQHNIQVAQHNIQVAQHNIQAGQHNIQAMQHNQQASYAQSSNAGAPSRAMSLLSRVSHSVHISRAIYHPQSPIAKAMSLTSYNFLITGRIDLQMSTSVFKLISLVVLAGMSILFYVWN
ncbi:unnamed protein product [Owenia fusiformis]|uniref:Uncharacterized protein n=1 Tax=Owenia fusiformis TaxID=6347 RepID=A0A8J1U5I1_OWEFU|nr:unnamed protein product [Owenia fusiformis]